MILDFFRTGMRPDDGPEVPHWRLADRWSETYAHDSTGWDSEEIGKRAHNSFGGKWFELPNDHLLFVKGRTRKRGSLEGDKFGLMQVRPEGIFYVGEKGISGDVATDPGIYRRNVALPTQTGHIWVREPRFGRRFSDSFTEERYVGGTLSQMVAVRTSTVLWGPWNLNRYHGVGRFRSAIYSPHANEILHGLRSLADQFGTPARNVAVFIRDGEWGVFPGVDPVPGARPHVERYIYARVGNSRTERNQAVPSVGWQKLERDTPHGALKLTRESWAYTVRWEDYAERLLPIQHVLLENLWRRDG